MKSWVPTRVILLILCVGLSICYVIPVTGSSEQVIKRIPYSGTVIGQNLTKWGTQVWYHGDVDLIFSRLKDLGVKWARIEYWKGHEDYMDSAIDTCRKYGINPLVLVNYPGETSISAEDYGLEVERIVRKYNLSVVELMNEPLEYGMWSSAEAYVNRIKAGYQGAKKANLDCEVIAAFGYVSQPIECDDGRLLSLENLKPYGFFRYIDGLVIHPYTYGANPDTWTGHGYTKYNELVGLAEVIQYLKDWLTANGYPDMPLWATEFNFHSTVEKQVEWGIRECEILRDKGIHVSIWYCFWLPSDYPQFTGTLVNDDPTLSSKPMFNAYQEFISTL